MCRQPPRSNRWEDEGLRMRFPVIALALFTGCIAGPSPQDAGGDLDAGVEIDSGIAVPPADGGLVPSDAGCARADLIEADRCGGEAESCAALQTGASQAIAEALDRSRTGCSQDDDCVLIEQVQIFCPFDPTFFYAACPEAVLREQVCAFYSLLGSGSQATCDKCREERCDSTPSCAPSAAVCRSGLCRAEVQ